MRTNSGKKQLKTGKRLPNIIIIPLYIVIIWLIFLIVFYCWKANIFLAITSILNQIQTIFNKKGALNNENSNLRVAMQTNQLQVIKKETTFPDYVSQSTNFTKNRKIIAYTVTITKDGPFVDGALVLGFAAKKIHSREYGYNSIYDIELVAFVVPTVIKARQVLEKFGWKIIEQTLPVKLEEIENKNYAEAMRNSGCCGADEFIKLWAFTMTQYHRVVHLDMDFIIFQNMDELYEKDKDLLYTGDYNMKGNSPVPPVQGGFLVIRPSIERFEELRAIIRQGNHGSSGWGGSRIGNFWGGQTIQGILPYFYHVVHHGDAEELNRCVYNCMVDNPYYPETTRCINGNKTCQDCRKQKPELVKSVHFTICQKPWTCTQHLNPRNSYLCEIFHDKWFEIRHEFETAYHIDSSKYRVKNSRYKNSMGMCKGYGDDKYIPIPIDMVTIQ